MNVQMKAKQQKGFTIIELVVVILLLGILAATALPRFLDVTEEAHDAVVDGTASALQTGMALFRAQYIAQQQPAAGSVLSTSEFNGLRVTAGGYPIGRTDYNSGTFSSDVELSETQCIEIYNGILQAGRAPVSPSGLDTETTAEPIFAAAGTAEDNTNSDLNGVSNGFIAKRVTATVTDVGSLEDAVRTTATADSYCIYVYAADANRRDGSDAVPAIAYFPFATNGTVPVEAGSVIQVTL